MATHASITGAPTRAPIFSRFARFNRAEIEQEIDRLIALLDAMDGDCDLEDDDPPGTPIDFAEGVGDHGTGLLRIHPLYGVDQSAGPCNYAAADRDHRARGMGMIRSPGGGWAYPRAQ